MKTNLTTGFVDPSYLKIEVQMAELCSYRIFFGLISNALSFVSIKKYNFFKKIFSILKV